MCALGHQFCVRDAKPRSHTLTAAAFHAGCAPPLQLGLNGGRDPIVPVAGLRLDRWSKPVFVIKGRTAIRLSLQKLWPWLRSLCARTAFYLSKRQVNGANASGLGRACFLPSMVHSALALLATS